MPAAGELPAAGAELVEEGDDVARPDGSEQRAVAGREMLVAVAPLARVDDRLAVVGAFECGPRRVILYAELYTLA